MSDSSLPVLVRRSDGARFRIALQARSPDGPVSLVACDGPPFENVETTNDRLLVDFIDPRKPAAPVRHPPNLEAVGDEGSGFNVNHVDGTGNRWPVCDCAAAHLTADDALDCARAALSVAGRRAFESYNHAVGGLTYDGKPIPGWDAVTENVRDGWRMAALAVRCRQALR